MNGTNRIKGLSDKRRLPRLGKIRLGMLKTSANGKTYPSEVSHFVVPPEVAKVYGETPTELDIMFPVEDEGTFFPQAYKLYGSSQNLKCKGDGETATKLDPETGELTEVPCPCELADTKGGCGPKGCLMVLLPKVSLGGVYQIDTGSMANMITINSYVDYLRCLIGQVAMVPLKLRRIEQKLKGPDGKMSKHYLLQIEFVGNAQEVRALRSGLLFGAAPAAVEKPRDLIELEAPKEDGPEKGGQDDVKAFWDLVRDYVALSGLSEAESSALVVEYIQENELPAKTLDWTKEELIDAKQYFSSLIKSAKTDQISVEDISEECDPDGVPYSLGEKTA